MCFEVVFLAVFKHEKAVFFQQVVLEDEVGESLQTRQFVGRVGKDEVELLTASLNVLEYVATDRETTVGLDFLHDFADESVVVAVFLDADYLVASSGQQFDTDASCACKEVEGTYPPSSKSM